MSYTREWTPTTVDLTRNPTITVKSWDNQTVLGVSYYISGNSLVVSVPTPNKYKITVRSGPTEETVKLNIPVSTNNSLEDRLRRYVEELVATNPGTGSGSVANITPDPNPEYEGYFIFTSPPAEETA